MLHQTGRTDDARGGVRACARALRRGQKQHPAARVAAWLGYVAMTSGRSEQAIAIMEDAYQAVQDDEPDEDTAFLISRLSQAYVFMGDERKRAHRPLPRHRGRASALRGAPPNMGEQGRSPLPDTPGGGEGIARACLVGRARARHVARGADLLRESLRLFDAARPVSATASTTSSGRFARPTGRRPSWRVVRAQRAVVRAHHARPLGRSARASLGTPADRLGVDTNLLSMLRRPA